MTNRLTTPDIQVRQALFEARRAVVDNDRLIERLAVGLLVGRPLLVGGPPGVGKCHAARTLGRVFALEADVRHPIPGTRDIAKLTGGRLNIVTDLETADLGALNELAAVLGGIDSVALVATVTETDPATLPRRVRDEMLMFVEVSYPEAGVEGRLARDGSRPRPVDPLLQPRDLERLRGVVAEVTIADPTLDYAVRLVHATRAPAAHGLANLVDIIEEGASPRATIGLVRAARGLAVLRGRREVVDQDVYDVAYDVLFHRIGIAAPAVAAGIGRGDVLVELLSRVPASLPESRLS